MKEEKNMENMDKRKHVVPLNFSIGSSQSSKSAKPLSACDCDGYHCDCDHGTHVCAVAADIIVSIPVDVDACGIWG